MKRLLARFEKEAIQSFMLRSMNCAMSSTFSGYPVCVLNQTMGLIKKIVGAGGVSSSESVIRFQI